MMLINFFESKGIVDFIGTFPIKSTLLFIQNLSTIMVNYPFFSVCLLEQHIFLVH